MNVDTFPKHGAHKGLLILLLFFFFLQSDADITLQQQQEEQVDQGQSTSPSLGQLVGKDEERATSKANKDAKLGDGSVSVDLKTLLPTQKMKFMKLDSFGRRLQRSKYICIVLNHEPVCFFSF